MTVVVRSAIDADAVAIASIHVRAWQAAYAGIIPTEYLDALSIPARTATWTASLEAGGTPDGGEIHVAEVGGAVVGWLTCGPSRDDGAPAHVGELHGIYVDPDFWGVGVGLALMDLCIEELRAKGFSSATLWVLTDNHAARAWYERRGWVFDGAEAVFAVAGLDLQEVRYSRDL